MDTETMLRGVLPPIVAALILVSALGARGLPLAAGAGLYGAYVLLKKQWPLLPHELWSDPIGEQWLVWSIALLGVVAAAEHARWLPPRATSLLGVGVAAFSVMLVLDKVRVAQQWSAADVWWFVGGGGLIAAASALGQRRLFARAPTNVLPAIAWTLILSVDAVIVVNGKSALMGQLCGAVAAAVGTSVGVALCWRKVALRPVDGIWLGLTHGLFLISAVHLAYLSWTPALLALAAPLLPLLAFARAAPDRPPPTTRWILAVAALTLAPMAVACWLSVPEANPYGY